MDGCNMSRHLVMFEDSRGDDTESLGTPGCVGRPRDEFSASRHLPCSRTYASWSRVRDSHPDEYRPDLIE